ncbi:putative 6-phosphogluconolactonase 1 [Canna indica]|uniref:Probable 6-phosphogluconolactonase n=1 Tax=Canna indica TaxID=4628 RepID=A0AAQ3QQI9_9LILI|nr:putative 6-phosphogluconolactonase 1 [Canna indica]
MASSSERKTVRVFESIDELAMILAEYISQLSEDYVRQRGCFTIALTGGSLLTVMGKLCQSPYDRTVDWTKWHVFWADERVVAKNHVDSNCKQTKDAFLSKVPILQSNIYSINDHVSVAEAARQYQFAIRQLVKIRTIDVSESNDCPKFDLILLGMETDGHIAALFPHHPALQMRDEWVTYIIDSPEPPPERITFTLPVINSASNVAIVATGKEKARTVQYAIVATDEDVDASSLPARMVQPTDGKLVWFLDEMAASANARNGGGQAV